MSDFGFLEQRSCRCSGTMENTVHESQTNLEVSDGNAFVIDMEDAVIDLQDETQNRFSGTRSSVVENASGNLPSRKSGKNKCKDGIVDDDESGRRENLDRLRDGEMEDVGEEKDIVGEQCSQSSGGLNCRQAMGQQQNCQTKETSHCEEDADMIQERSAIDNGNLLLLERGNSPMRIVNEDRLSNAASSASFSSTLCSSSEINNGRIHSRLEGNVNDLNVRSQGSNVHHQVVKCNGFNSNNRSNLKITRDNNRSNVEDVGGEIIEENLRVGHLGMGGSYGTGFHNLHSEHIMQNIRRQSNGSVKGTFDTIPVSAGNTLEKSKCQCHHIQQHQHQHQQRLPQIQQRDQIHQHHHHQHRHKILQQPQQQQQRSQQQQQQNYRHHHYHHPHQHLNQQQDHQRQQSDQPIGRNKRGVGRPDDDTDEMIETNLGGRQPPALPPRPLPPRPNRRYQQNSIANYDLGPNNGEDTGCCKKYVVLCCLCGGLSAAVGSLFLAVHAVLSAHTASLALFETVPSYIPGTMLILMGLFTILLARRKHRYGFLMKMCGSVGVVCALTCVLVTITTTVVHMSRLQALRRCIYTKMARSCTCYEADTGETGVLFEETPHCEAVHGALYDCLRALFGVSVAGILACIFSCMLLYQLLSHEKKKMYWEQLQLRCRSLYGLGGSGAVGGAVGGSCGCCNDCGGAGPWWAQTPGNLYTPNPDLAPFSRRWRLPWSRFRGPAPTPDSNYGFHTQSRGAIVMRSNGSSGGAGDNTPGPYSVLGDESQVGAAPYSLINGSNSAPYAACTSSVASYSLLENGTLPPLWGPPPPYSDPNSPARRPQLTDDRRPAPTRPPPPTAPSVTPTNVANVRTPNKRTIDGFEPINCEEYRQQRGTPKRPSDNYENTEEILSNNTSPDIEMSALHQHHHHHHQPTQQLQQQHSQDDDPNKNRRLRKALKGVENGGFQQEVAIVLAKQSESELYFGDVSSCCGPESSFYDLAVDKEQGQVQTGSIDPGENILEYPTTNRLGKHQRQSSKRSRLPLPLPALNSGESSTGSLTENYAALNNPGVGDEVVRNASTRGPFLAPDAQYEVIAQQTRYTYYNSKSGEHVLEIPLSSLASLAYRNGANDQQMDMEIERTNDDDYFNDRQRLPEHCSSEGAVGSTAVEISPAPSVSSEPTSPISHSINVPQRCSNDSGPRDSTWQNEQGRTTQTPEGVCPVNV